MRYILLMRDTPAGPEVADYGECPEDELRPLAEVSAGRGWHLMFEFQERPDMKEVVRAIQEMRGVSSLPGLARLWRLR